METKILNEILKRNQTVFSFREILLLSGKKASSSLLKAKINYYVKQGYLYHIRRGLYAKDKYYNRLELATKIYTPSYISFETVLAQAGVIFQYYGQIFVATYQSKEVRCDGQIYIFRQLRPAFITNARGVIKVDNYYIATPERAFLDMLYLHTHYYFDNLRPLNWELVYKILPGYGNNKSLKNRVDKQHAYFKKISAE